MKQTGYKCVLEMRGEYYSLIGRWSSFCRQYIIGQKTVAPMTEQKHRLFDWEPPVTLYLWLPMLGFSDPMRAHEWLLYMRGATADKRAKKGGILYESLIRGYGLAILEGEYTPFQGRVHEAEDFEIIRYSYEPVFFYSTDYLAPEETWPKGTIFMMDFTPTKRVCGWSNGELI